MIAFPGLVEKRTWETQISRGKYLGQGRSRPRSLGPVAGQQQRRLGPPLSEYFR